MRLKRNKQALVSLYTIGALVVFAVAGPWIWTVDPSYQDLGRISETPSLGKMALVVGPVEPYEEVVLQDVPESPTADGASLPASASLEVMGTPTREAVRLQWKPVPGAAGYVIYRAEGEKAGSSLGVPIGSVEGGNHVSYEDTFNLESGAHFYSVVATNGEESQYFVTRRVDIPSTIGESDAQLVSPDAKVGDQLKLKPHPLGTDYLGRDLLARLMAGARVSLFIGFFAPFLSIAFGVLIGGIAGYAGGRIDSSLMRFTDFVLALPFLLFMILFKVAFGAQPGESGLIPMLVALVVLSWTSAARLTRGQLLSLREAEFVQASRLLGAKPHYLLLRHLLPNTLGVILVTLTFSIPTAIFTEAFLSFIGMGVVPPTPSWGSMCSDGIQTFLTSPHEFFFPAILISLTVLAFNLFGDGLRDALDPRLRAGS
jgi:oligopeptide transport system permease protein